VALEKVEHDLSFYHIDDEYSFSPVEQGISSEEYALMTKVDQVFVHSPGLLEKKGHINPNTAYVNNGVDYLAYSTPYDEPADMRKIPHPRLGYTGVIKNQLNWDLLTDLSSRYQDCSFVFVGPMAPHPEIIGPIEKMSRFPNVYFLGAKSVKELTGYPQHFDVCIMPYLADDYTKYIYPLKLHEYLASGRPVVGTTIPSLLEFADVISLVNTPEEWSLAIRKELAPEAMSEERVHIRQSIAKRYDWDTLIQKITHTFCQRLGSPYLEQFEQKSMVTKQ
jgi:glycosyltransferase involved in cell wall biosynthesis